MDANRELFSPVPTRPLVPDQTALINIDVQNVQVYGLADRVRRAGLNEVYDYYNVEVARILPRIRALQSLCRANGFHVMHLRCASFTGDGHDCSTLFRSVDIKGAGEDRGAQLLTEVGAEENEIVITKVAAGAFNGSDLDAVLRNVGIDTVIFTRLVTAGCVEGTARGAADRGYDVFVVEDACAAWTPEQQTLSLRILGRWFARLLSCAEISRIIAESSSFRSDESQRFPLHAV
jgi:nicotinamidase-related amidase